MCVGYGDIGWMIGCVLGYGDIGWMIECVGYGDIG